RTLSARLSLGPSAAAATQAHQAATAIQKTDLMRDLEGSSGSRYYSRRIPETICKGQQEMGKDQHIGDADQFLASTPAKMSGLWSAAAQVPQGAEPETSTLRRLDVA